MAESSPSFSLPVIFGTRQVDRLFQRLLLARLSLAADSAFGIMVRLWQNFAVDPDSEWIVPEDQDGWSTQPPVLLIEEFCHFEGEPGKLVRAGVDSGFLVVAPVDVGRVRIRAKGFDEQNRRAPDAASLGSLGGIARARKHAAKHARTVADEALELFERRGDDLLKMGPQKIHEGLVIITQITRILRWPEKTDPVFLSKVVPLAIQVRGQFGAEFEDFLGWLHSNRDCEELPARVDLLLEKAEELLPAVRAWRKSMGG